MFPYIKIYVSVSHSQFCCHHCSTWGPYSLDQAVQESPHYVLRNPVSVQSMALLPCQLDCVNEKGKLAVCVNNVHNNVSKII